MGNNQLLFSKLTSKSQTVIPKKVREQLHLVAGDLIRYRVRAQHVEIEKFSLTNASDNPFVAFDEWASTEDDQAYAKL